MPVVIELSDLEIAANKCSGQVPDRVDWIEWVRMVKII
jgi:hypothetical protein